MTFILPRDEIAKQADREYHGSNRKAVRGPQYDPKLADAIALVTKAVEEQRGEQRKHLTTLLSALNKPAPTLKGFTLTVTARDAKGRIKDVDFKPK